MCRGRRPGPAGAALGGGHAGRLQGLGGRRRASADRKVRNLADFLADAKAAELWCYGADQDGTEAYDAVDYGRRLVLVLGSEGTGAAAARRGGLRRARLDPAPGRIESLSVSAAAAVLMFEAAAVNRQAGLHGA